MEAQVEGVDLLGDAPEWQERALCSQTDPEAFFPEKGGSTREAKRICGRATGGFWDWLSEQANARRARALPRCRSRVVHGRMRCCGRP